MTLEQKPLGSSATQLEYSCVTLRGTVRVQETKVNPDNHHFGGTGAKGLCKAIPSYVNLVQDHRKEHQPISSAVQATCFTSRNKAEASMNGSAPVTGTAL